MFAEQVTLADPVTPDVASVSPATNPENEAVKAGKAVPKTIDLLSAETVRSAFVIFAVVEAVVTGNE